MCVLPRFCDGTQFGSLSSYAQSMAIAMMESPMIALRKHMRLRGLADEGTRPKLIVKICSQYDRADRQGNGSNSSKDE